jgi:hypothetical protein
MVTIERGGHFLPLDRAEEVIRHLRDFYGCHSTLPSANSG